MRAGVWLSILVASSVCAFALDPSLDISQYAHTAWKIDEGFTKGTITSIAQTPDGYLWLGTEFGLLRFDGVRSVPWQPQGSERLPSSNIRTLLVSRDGTLWIGTHEGLASRNDGKLTQYPGVPGQRIDALLEDHEGTIWAGVETIPSWSLCAIRKGGVQCYGEDGSLGLGVGTLFEDRKGNLWAGTGTSLWHWRPGVPERVPLSGPASEIHAMTEGDDGAVLISTRGGIIQLADGKVTAFPLPGTEPDFNPFRLLRDRNGGLWVGTIDRGLLHVHQGRTDHFGHSDGLSGDSIDQLFEDREGNVWVCTSNGLDRFRDFAVTAIPVKQGLANAYVESVLPARDGSVWLGTRNGLDRWQDGRLTLYRKRRTQAQGTDREITDDGLPDDYQSSLFQDHHGRIWVFSRGGAAYLEGDRFVPVRAMPGGFAHAIAEDSAGDLWISQDQGLFHLLRGSVVEEIPWARLGRQGLALALAADPAQGGLWLGYSQGGVAYFKGGQVRASYTAAQGLGGGRVNGLTLDHEGTLWVATKSGLSRVENGHIATLTSKNGLPCNAVNWAMEDDAHSFWLYMTCGLVHIARPELDAWVTNPKRTIQATAFDNSDGLRLVAITGGLSPLVGKSTDGRLWYVSEGGVFVVDPRRLHKRQFSFNKLPPPVHVEEVIADGKTYDASSTLHLPPLVRDVWIDYTALSFVAPEKVRFRYKLEGQDPDWKEVVNERQAQYSNLPPRKYRFRVTACNNNGVWNQDGAFLDFTIAPAYYQTYWFRGFCGAVVLALVWLLLRLRIRQVHQQERRFREAIETIPAMAFTAQPDGSRTFVNRRWVEYTGLSVEQAAGSGWGVAVHPDDLSRVLEKWRMSLATGEPLDYEARFRGADGEYRWFHVRAVPLRDNDGKTLKWYGVATDIEDRKRAEEAARRSESELRDLIESVPAMVFIALQGPSNAFASRRWREYTGLSAEETQGLGWQGVVHPEDLERHMEKWRACSVTGEHYEDETRFRRAADGEYRWFLVRAVPLRDETGHILKWYGVLTDIEERKQAEQALQRSEAYLLEAQRLSHTGSFAYNPVTRKTPYWSDELFRIFGFDPRPDHSAPPEDFRMVHPDDFERVSKECRKAFGEKAEFTQDYRLLLRDKTLKHLHVVWHPVLDKDGELIEYIGTAADVSERKRAEEALRRSEAYLADAQRLTHTGSWAYRPGGGAAYWSEENFRIWGFDPQQGVPDLDAVRQRIHPEDRDREIEYAESAARAGRDFAHEFRIVLPNGEVRHLQAVGHLIFNADGAAVEVVGTHVDVTERKRAEEERERLHQLEADLAHMNRVTMLGELASSLAHEINQPIAAAITSANACLRWLARNPPDLERARAAATRIERDGGRAAEIIQRLRTFCKTGTPPQRELVDINEVVGEILVLLRDEASEHSISLRTELAPQLPQIMADRVQLQQVLMNLMLNGIEAMSDGGGELTIRSQRSEHGYLLISVSDTGVGLPDEKADLIFNAFYTTKPQGTGMGLAISRSIIEAHGGRLWATANEQRGATFHLTMPAEVHQ